MRLGLCNSLPGHSRCSASVGKGKCPGMEKGRCCSDQLHNASDAEKAAAQGFIEQRTMAHEQITAGVVSNFMLAGPGPQTA